jgi:hypothetical protein
MDGYQADAIVGPRCSTLARRLGEPLAGTASVAVTWLAIEQPGPWGREALLDSHLDADVARELAERVRGTGVRIAMIRRPGSHPDRHRPIRRQVYLAHTAPGRTWLERWPVSDAKELLDLDFPAVGSGSAPGIGDRLARPLLLLCTNARRDVCCALLGRPIAAALADVPGADVWECSHTGGHRFAPTGVALPTGYLYGRLDLASAARLLEPGTGVLIDNCRGRSTWSPAGQVAELAVRRTIDDQHPDSLMVTESETHLTVSHVDGRSWRITVAERTSPDLRSTSCGAAPKPSTFLEVESVTAA